MRKNKALDSIHPGLGFAGEPNTKFATSRGRCLHSFGDLKGFLGTRDPERQQQAVWTVEGHQQVMGISEILRPDAVGS